MKATGAPTERRERAANWKKNTDEEKQSFKLDGYQIQISDQTNV